MKPLRTTLGAVAALMLFAMMVLTFCDVVGRKAFGSSIPGVVEVTELLMLLLIFVAMPLTSLHGEHILFDLLDKFLPESALDWQHRLANFLCVGLLAASAWLVWVRAGRTLEQGDTTSSLHLPLGPFYYLTALMLLACAAAHGWLAFQPRGESQEQGA